MKQTFADRAGPVLGRVAVSAYRHPVAVTIAAAVLAVVAFFGARNLRLDADLVELLPPSFQSVRDIDKLKERFGAIGYVAVVASGAEPQALRQFADDLAPKLEALPDIRYVEYRHPGTFLRDHGLYYVDVEDLETILERLEDREAEAKRKANPLLVDLDDEDDNDDENGARATAIDFGDIIQKYEKRFGLKLSKQASDDYYLNPKTRVIALLAKPAQHDTDLSYAQRVVEEVVKVVSEATKPTAENRAKYGPDFHVEMAGGYTKKVDQQKMIMRDLGLSTSLAAFLVLAFVSLLHRRFSAPFIVAAPLVFGLVWSFGFAGYVYGTLNILTGFIGAILTGLGIDHGIHLLGRYEFERRQGKPAPDALFLTFAETGRAAVVAALTTTVAFAGLGLSEFRAFREFGVLAAVAMVLLVSAYTICFPVVMRAAERLGWHPSLSVPSTESSWFARWLRRASGRFVAVQVVAMVVASWGLTKLDFDFNFRNLVASDLPSFKLDAVIDGLLGYSQTPVVVFADRADDDRAIIKALKARKKENGEQSTIHLASSLRQLVPDGQLEKRTLIQKMNRILEQVEPSQLPPVERRNYLQALTMTRTSTFGFADLPAELRRRFAQRDASQPGSVVLVYASVDLSDGANAKRFAHEVRDIPLGDGRTTAAAGGPMVMADIFEMVIHEAPPVLLFTLVLVFITSWLLIGRLKDALLALFPAFTTMLLTLGLLPFTTIHLNYLNIVMIPVLFGIAVDGGAHIMTRVRAGTPLDEIVAETGRSIAGALLTTAFGFGALLLADHKGLRSLAEFSLFGLAINLMACLVFMPALLARFSAHDRKATPS
ncbi:MAG: MMPL family transporter [Deltaproteobacteria bacterium]|nr:MMPL family transporter [Deltaproteobacteria bacterium]